MAQTTPAARVEQYRYHLAGIKCAESHKYLDGVVYSIQTTVPANHPERPLLLQAIVARRAELGERQPHDKTDNNALFPPANAKLIG